MVPNGEEVSNAMTSRLWLSGAFWHYRQALPGISLSPPEEQREFLRSYGGNNKLRPWLLRPADSARLTAHLAARLGAHVTPDELWTKLLKLIQSNALESHENLARMLGLAPAEVSRRIADYEKRGVIRGYQAILNEDQLDLDKVTAVIEVKVTPATRGRLRHHCRAHRPLPRGALGLSHERHL